MIYSTLLNSLFTTARKPGGIVSPGRLLAATTLVLALVAGLPGFASQAHAQETAAAPASAVVNINSADAATMAANLKGVGQSRAQEIVRYREAYGPFRSVDELADVKGIGKSTLEQNRALITLE